MEIGYCLMLRERQMNGIVLVEDERDWVEVEDDRDWGGR
jgi:hypothetical protein